MTDPINPYSAPSDSSAAARRSESYSASWDGKRLTFDTNAKLPRVCLKCGGETDVKRRTQTFQWVPPVAYFALLLGIVPFFVVYAFARRVAKPSIPLCAPCRERVDGAPTFVGVGGLVCGLPLIAAAVFASNGMWLVAGGLAVLHAAGIAYVAREAAARSLTPARIVGGKVTLRGVSPTAAQRIVETQSEAT